MKSDIHNRIHVEIYKAVFKIAPDQVELLCILGSLGDSMSDEDVLECLEQFNEKGTCRDEVLASVWDTPSDRRKRFKLIANATGHPIDTLNGEE